jgi:hypothetical protein
MPVLTKTIVENTNHATLYEYADVLANVVKALSEAADWEDDPTLKASYQRQAEDTAKAANGLRRVCKHLRNAEDEAYDRLYDRCPRR